MTDAWYLAQDPGGNMHSPLVQEHFQYDQLGNRFGSNQTISYGTIDFLRRDNGLNQYASWTPSVIYYDDNHPGWTPPGNGVLMADGYITASYNALNQPRAIWSPTPAGTSNYTWFGFDPLGRCVKRWVGPLMNGGYPPPETNPATYFLYDGWNMIEEGPGGGGVSRVYAHGARVDEIIASSNEVGAVLFHHYDALGNCILLSDGAGNLFEQYDYEAFGKPYFYNTIGTNIPESTWKNRYLGKGREWSELGSRDIDGKAGRPSERARASQWLAAAASPWTDGRGIAQATDPLFLLTLGQMGMSRTFRPSYRYLPLTGRDFSSYGIEQQAQIQEDAYLLSKGQHVTDVTRTSGHPIPSLSAYEALLPFNH